MTETVGQALRRLRGRESLAAVAKRAQISCSFLCEVEKDKKLPSPKTLAKITAALGVPISSIPPSPAKTCACGTEIPRSRTRCEPCAEAHAATRFQVWYQENAPKVRRRVNRNRRVCSNCGAKLLRASRWCGFCEEEFISV